MSNLTVEERLTRLESFFPRLEVKSDLLNISEEERRKLSGERIKARRKQIGLTQAEVARRLGIASQSVTNYESGKTDPSIRNLISLATVLDISIDWLLGNE